MYDTIDDEVFLAPESIVAGILAASAFDDGSEWPALTPADDARFGDAEGEMPIAYAARARGAEWDRDRTSADAIDAWSRRARGANGFGG